MIFTRPGIEIYLGIKGRFHEYKLKDKFVAVLGSFKYFLDLVSVLGRTFSAEFFEQLVKMREVVESAVIADVGDSHGFFSQ